MYIFHVENSGEEVVRECVRACVRVCICVWASARLRGRVLSYSKPPFWKIYFVGTQPVLTRMHCPKQSCLANWLFDWTDVFKNQFRHMHKQICAVCMMQRNLCWLSQGLVHQTIWNCQHVGLSPVKWIFENCVKGSLSSCAGRWHVNHRLMDTQIVFWGLDSQSGLVVSLHIVCRVGQPPHAKNR